METHDRIAGRKLIAARLAQAVGPARSLRLRHALWAAAIAMLLAVTHTLEPLDMYGWTLQSRLKERAPSGQIVFVEVDGNVSDPGVPAKRQQLAKLIESVRTSGAARVYLDLLFDQPSTPTADAQLRAAAMGWGNHLWFVNRVDVAPGGKGETFSSVDAVAKGSPRVWWGISTQWPNMTFELPYGYDLGSHEGRSFASALAKVPDGPDSFQVDYGFARTAIINLSAAKLERMGAAQRRAILAHKTVVVSTRTDASGFQFTVPSQYAAPPSYVAIYAAETLMRGGMGFIGTLPATAAIAMLLLAASLATRRRWRYWIYSTLVFLCTYGFFASTVFNIRIALSCGLAAIVIYVGLRSRSHWQDRGANVDPDTGLPTLRAFATELAAPGQGSGFVAMAKVQGYEAILQTLDTAQRAAYIMKLCERLRIGDSRRTIYVDGQHLAWQVDETSGAKLFAHLEGLRAIFAAPVAIGRHTVDVGITFGAAPILPGEPDRSIAIALAAVEETSEALEPVKVSEAPSSSDGLWDLSLRARIDAAMEAGEVFCVYQPKMDIAADRIVGVEALVRWEDPERGYISPIHFVMQCEKAGRMEYLTRYVLQSACSAGKLLHFRGIRITMSVNISATLLTDMRIVGIVRNVIQATGFDPNYLVLEITETARIRDLTEARSVLKALKALGTHLSMDDFGVGAANFEALQALPFDEIKIDRQFVSRATSSNKARAITASIVGLGASARISVVAEGAETESDLQMLREIGCWQVQGFALARPMPLTDLLTFVGTNPESEQTAAV